jgi:hypothetical protein
MSHKTKSLSDRRILILGVNPFEDTPGYQLLGLLRAYRNARVFAADDSLPAITILRHIGTNTIQLPHPSSGLQRYTKAVLEVCDQLSIDILLPATDAHLSALAQSLPKEGRLASLCPHLVNYSVRRLYNKCEIQDYLSSFGNTPPRMPYLTEKDIVSWDRDRGFPAIVKGMRKGAVKCADINDALSAKRAILKNPANRGACGGAYIETAIDGEESTFLVVVARNGNVIAQIGLRKLAVTAMGTTLLAEVCGGLPRDFDFYEFLGTLSGPAVIEIESRVDSEGIHWMFEANLRFPSWIGALNGFGTAVVESFIDNLFGLDAVASFPIHTPPTGTLIYRLPESGTLPLASTFDGSMVPRPRVHRTNGRVLQPLWSGAAPHQFLNK